MNLIGLLPDLFHTQYLINCFCNVNRVCDDFVVWDLHDEEAA